VAYSVNREDDDKVIPASEELLHSTSGLLACLSDLWIMDMGAQVCVLRY